VYLQYTSSRDKKYIREALALEDWVDAVKKGWKLVGSGAFRKAYRKGNIVVKFAHDNSCKVHMKERSFYLSAPPHMRKFLARVFAVGNRRVVQRYVPHDKHKWTKAQHEQAVQFIDALDIEDAYPAQPGRKKAHNMAIYKGNPVLFDFNCEEPKAWKRLKRRRKDVRLCR